MAALLLALGDLETSRRSVGDEDVSRVLAHELAYDRALIALSRHIGIEAGPERFEVPKLERDRLHRELVEVMPSLQEVLCPCGGVGGDE